MSFGQDMGRSRGGGSGRYLWTKLRPKWPKTFWRGPDPFVISGSGRPGPRPTPFSEGLDPPLQDPIQLF